MTNEEIITRVKEVLDAVNFRYQPSIESGKAFYTEQKKCFDGVVRNTYSLGFYTSTIGSLIFAILDADTGKVIFIFGALFIKVVKYGEDGTITLEEGGYS